MTQQPSATAAAQWQLPAIPAAYVRSLLQIAILSRVCLLLLAITSYHLLPSYDHSTQLFFPPDCTSTTDRLIQLTLSPLLRWDALQFLAIARDGYQVEKQHAFFPLLPATLSAIAYPLGALLGLCSSTALLLSSLLLNCVLLPLSVSPLYRLTLLLSSSPSVSYLSCVLWLLCPSAVFVLCGGYTELLYSCCVYWGLWLCATDRLLLSSCVLCLAAWTRSNGSLLCIFPLVRCTQQAYSRWRDGPTSRQQQVLTSWLVSAAVCGLLVVGPSLLYSHVSSLDYCAARPVINSTQPLPAYCFHWLPSMYSYIQSTYWNVGPFHYWQLHQLPNFALATPALTTATAAIHWSTHRGSGWWVYGVYCLVLVAVCVIVVHVQVSTRLLSAVPLLYWYMADCWQRSERHATWLLTWCLAYATVGTVLFSLFLPWT